MSANIRNKDPAINTKIVKTAFIVISDINFMYNRIPDRPNKGVADKALY